MTATFSIDLPHSNPTAVPTTIQGRLTVSDRPLVGPSVFLLPGTGLSDGDGNDSDLGFAPLAQLAQVLGDAGINSLRFDRRGTGATGGDCGTPIEELQDFVAVLDAAQQIPELPQPLVLLGLAEAAPWAVLLAVQQPEAIAGVILISPPTGAVGDMFPYRQQADMALAVAPAADHRQIITDLVAEYGSRSPLFMLKPIFDITCPLLVVHGDMDWVCPVYCSRHLAAELEKRSPAGGDWTYRELAGIDRWLIATDRWRSLEQQLQPHWKIDQGAVDILVDWLTQKY